MFSFNNMNSGYSGYSMSNRAVDAYEDGEMPLSKWRKCDIVEGVLDCADDNDIEISEELLNKLTKSELVAHFLYRSSWHHTSSYANATDFYSIDSDKIDESTEEEINKIISSRVKKTREKNEKKEPPLKVTALCEYKYWTGPRAYRRYSIEKEVLRWTEGQNMVETSTGRKRLSSITVNFKVTDKEWLTDECLLEQKRIEEKKREFEMEEKALEFLKKLYNDIGPEGVKWYRENQTEKSRSGNIYVCGRKPSSTDYEHQESFFYKGEHRIYMNYDSKEVTYIFQTWDGEKWLNPVLNRSEDNKRCDYAAYLDFVSKDGKRLKHIQEQTPEICLTAVKEDASAFEYVKEQTEEICTMAVSKNAFALKSVKNQTSDICEMAVSKNALALKYVKVQTPDICEMAVSKNALALEYVKVQTPDICEMAVSKNALALEYVKVQTLDICEMAVSKNALALEYVKVQTPDICEMAVSKNALALEYVKNQTPEFCMMAVQQNGKALQFVNKQTEELCLEAVMQDGRFLAFVKKPTLTVCLAAVKKYRRALECLENQTPEICLGVVKKYGSALKYVREQTPEICLAAVKKCGGALKYVKRQTPEICLAAVQKDGKALQFVKKHNLSRKICSEALKQNSCALDYIKDQSLKDRIAKMHQ